MTSLLRQHAASLDSLEDTNINNEKEKKSERHRGEKKAGRIAQKTEGNEGKGESSGAKAIKNKEDVSAS